MTMTSISPPPAPRELPKVRQVEARSIPVVKLFTRRKSSLEIKPPTTQPTLWRNLARDHVTRRGSRPPGQSQCFFLSYLARQSLQVECISIFFQALLQVRVTGFDLFGKYASTYYRKQYFQLELIWFILEIFYKSYKRFQEEFIDSKGKGSMHIIL